MEKKGVYCTMTVPIPKEAERDVTSEYAGMIQAFECDLSLAADPEQGYGLDDLQIKIEQRDERLIRDIGLIQKLAYGLRYGKIKIIETEGGFLNRGK